MWTWMTTPNNALVLLDQATGQTLGGITPTHEHDLLGLPDTYDVYRREEGFLGTFTGLDCAKAALVGGG